MRKVNYKIYQIDGNDISNIEYMFEPFNELTFSLDRYCIMYESILASNEADDLSMCEELYRIFNIERPDDFKGHSMSVSDVVDIDGNLYYCDSFGFVKINRG